MASSVPSPHKRPSADRLQALRDYYLDNADDWVDGEGDVADLFAEIDGLLEQYETLSALYEQKVKRVEELSEQLEAVTKQRDACMAAAAAAPPPPAIVDAATSSLLEQYQSLRDLIDGAGVAFEDSRLDYIEIQVDREAFLALRPDSIPTSSPCDHTWSLPENAGVFRCMKCGVETTDVAALNPAKKWPGATAFFRPVAPTTDPQPPLEERDTFPASEPEGT